MPAVPESLDHSAIDFKRYYAYGTLLNVPPILLMYPLRTVRLLQQSKQATPVSSSITTVIRDVGRRQGYRALFAGSAIFTGGLTATKLLQFGTYDYLMARIRRENNNWRIPILKNQNVVSGVLGTFSAFVTCFFMVPFDVVSQQITMAKAAGRGMTSTLPITVVGSYEPLKPSPPMTISESLRLQYHQEGVRFLFRGYAASLMSTVPFFSVYFVAYEKSRVWVKDGINYVRETQAARPGKNLNPFPPTQSHQLIISSLAGTFASLTGVLVSSPFDMVKTRIQTEQRLQPTSGSGVKLPLPSLRWMDVFQEILKKEGVRAFFSGTKARALLSVPGGALNFIIFDFVRSISLKDKLSVPLHESKDMQEALWVLEQQTQAERRAEEKARAEERKKRRQVPHPALTLEELKTKHGVGHEPIAPIVLPNKESL